MRWEVSREAGWLQVAGLARPAAEVPRRLARGPQGRVAEGPMVAEAAAAVAGEAARPVVVLERAR